MGNTLRDIWGGREGKFHLCVPIVSGECLGVAAAIARDVAEGLNVLGLRRRRRVRWNIHSVRGVSLRRAVDRIAIGLN